MHAYETSVMVSMISGIHWCDEQVFLFNFFSRLHKLDFLLFSLACGPRFFRGCTTVRACLDHDHRTMTASIV